ncbi:cuticle protein 18.6-like [Daphnia carinata]|uniref:cuticle protein 18.6-like n=1 Tax=Daphnia carinata TaxID=120202 RepID=UPI00257EC30F|nr:cuticle protein 18.6-like [Daphnia carinata]
MNKFIALATVFAAIIAAELPVNAKPSYAKPSYPSPGAYPTPSPAYQKPGNERPAYGKPAEASHPLMPFSFAYEVKDDPTSQDFAHKENSDGKVISGSYRVVLPDSRIQIVTYKADENGYTADVKYEGEAKYDEYKPSAAPAYTKPNYSAEPAYPKPIKSDPSSFAKAAHPKPAYPKPVSPKPYN